MKSIKFLKLLLSIFMVFLAVHAVPVLAVDLNSFGGRVFLLQKKMALRGNALAQYKLGTFYEFGVSVKPNINEAKIWYKKSIKKKYRPAINRLMYLEILQSRFVASKHAGWLKDILAEAKFGRPDALIIAGQLYHRGIGVKRDLKKSLSMLKKAASVGHIEVNREIQTITKIMSPAKKIPKKQRTKVVVSKQQAPVSAQKVVIDEPKKEPAKIQTASTNTEKTAKLKQAKKESRELRRLRYEAAMRKYYQQQLILQQQQDWSENAEDDVSEE